MSNSFIWPLDRMLGQSGLESNDNEEDSPKLQHYWGLTIKLFSVLSREQIGGRGIFWPFDPAQNAIPRWCTGRKWHILVAVRRGNRVGGNWLTKWDKLKNPMITLIDWCTGREWPLNCMTVISAWWRLNMRFQRSSGWSSGRWTMI